MSPSLRKTRGKGSTTIPDYARRVLDVVDRIPRGKVMAYGDIAAYLGEGGPRQVGAVLREWGHEVPWHRVLLATGRPPAHKTPEQLELLRADGVLADNGRVDMRVVRWNPYDRASRGGRRGSPASPSATKLSAHNRRAR